MANLAELQAREQEVQREWLWLRDTLNEIARVRASPGAYIIFVRTNISCRS